MVNIAKKAELSARDKVMQLPPIARARCLEAMHAEIEASPPPETLRHALTVGGEKTKVLAEYRGALEDVLGKLLVSTRQSCARQLFAAADPVQLVGASGITADAPSASGVSGIIADAPYGLSAATDNEFVFPFWPCLALGLLLRLSFDCLLRLSVLLCCLFPHACSCFIVVFINFR